jgi:exodeoxyribonuclease VII large subunit
MPRLPFDPSQAEGPPPDRNRAARREQRTYARVTEAGRLTVSQLAELIKTTLEQRIPSPIRVIGEVSNLSAKNHWYFSLKDDAAVVSCVAWASAAKKFGFTPRDGDEVVAIGHVSHYPPQGRTQLYVTELKPVGAGALEQQFRAMCEALRKLGYFDEDRKKPLPAFPRWIAVITSASGAAVQDVISTAAQRCPAVGLLIVDVRVQGEGAAAEVARAIRWVDHEHERLGVDAILVTRGGGAIEDLWAFNERIVADATFACSVPLVAAIGHESDTTVIELVADLRAATPTQAAMRLVPAAEELARQIGHLEHRLIFLTRRRIEQARDRLTSIERHETFRDPRLIIRQAVDRVRDLDRDLGRVIRGRVIQDRARLESLAGRFDRLRPHRLVGRRHERLAVLAHRLDEAIRDRLHQRPRLDVFHARLHRAVDQHLDRARHRLAAIDRELSAVDPRQVLRRGYSFTTGRRGELIRSIRDVKTGDLILTNLADGSIESVVGRSRHRQRRAKRDGDEASQMDLFDHNG